MVNIFSIGVDIVSVERVKRLYSRYGERFVKRVYAGEELLYLQKRPDKGPFLAGRFAAKEAVLKVFGSGLFSGIRLTDIEIRSMDSGRPYCVLCGNASNRAAELGIQSVLVSISHCDAYAVSQAVGLTSTEGCSLL